MGGAWLFVQGSESIWIQRGDGADELVLMMHGPAGHKRRYLFADEAALQSFLTDAERRLTGAGWWLQRFRPGEDRRRRRTLRMEKAVERRRAG
jgi:hypothetical protein